MFKQMSRRWRTQLNIAALTTAWIVGGVALPGWAEFAPPNTLSRPGSRFGAGTRAVEPPRHWPVEPLAPPPPLPAPPVLAPARPRLKRRPGSDVLPQPIPTVPLPRKPSLSQCLVGDQRPLTTLVPKSLSGQTVSGYPTFYVYMPSPNTYDWVQFDLYAGMNANQRLVYRSTFQTLNQSGIARLTLPEDPTVMPLDVGKTYRWQITLVCLSQPSQNIWAEGWIERVSPSPKFKTDLATATSAERFKVYAQASLWYDLLRELAEQRQTVPNNVDIEKAWQDLMVSEVVALPQMVTQPLIMQERP